MNDSTTHDAMTRRKDERIADARVSHKPLLNANGYRECTACCVEWPCEAGALLAELDARTLELVKTRGTELDALDTLRRVNRVLHAIKDIFLTSAQRESHASTLSLIADAERILGTKECAGEGTVKVALTPHDAGGLRERAARERRKAVEGAGAYQFWTRIMRALEAAR